MSAHTDEIIKRRVVQHWFNGFPRDTIAAENNIGAGTVSSIIANYKAGLLVVESTCLMNLVYKWDVLICLSP
jgi:hypothetical protein